MFSPRAGRREDTLGFCPGAVTAALGHAASPPARHEGRGRESPDSRAWKKGIEMVNAPKSLLFQRILHPRRAIAVTAALAPSPKQLPMRCVPASPAPTGGCPRGFTENVWISNCLTAARGHGRLPRWGTARWLRVLAVALSQNPSMVGVGRDLCGSSSPTPYPSRVTQSRLHRTLSRWVWNISREGQSNQSVNAQAAPSVLVSHPPIPRARKGGRARDGTRFGKGTPWRRTPEGSCPPLQGDHRRVVLQHWLPGQRRHQAPSPLSQQGCLPRGSSVGKDTPWLSLEEKPLARRAGGAAEGFPVCWPHVPLPLSNQVFN